MGYNLISPTSTRHSTGTGWVFSGGGTAHGVLSDANLTTTASHTGAIGRLSLGLTAGDFESDGTTKKCRRLRVVLQGVTQDFKAGLAEEDAGANDIPYDLIDGNTWPYGVGGLLLAVWHTPWLYPSADIDWSTAELATKSVYIESDGTAALYEVHVEEDFIGAPVIAITSPTLTQWTSPYHDFRWTFTTDSSYPEEQTQKKFRVRVWDKAYVDGLGGGFVPDTDLNMIADSGIVNGAVNHYSFAAMEGGQLTSPIPYEDNEYYVYVKAATDINGGDFWGDWSRFVFHVPDPPVLNLYTPAPFSTAAPGAVGAAWSETGGFPGAQIGFEFRIYNYEDLPTGFEYWQQGSTVLRTPDDAEDEGIEPVYQVRQEGWSDPDWLERPTTVKPGYAVAFVRIREGLFGLWTEWQSNGIYLINSSYDATAIDLWSTQDPLLGRTNVRAQASRDNDHSPYQATLERRVDGGFWEKIHEWKDDAYKVEGVRLRNIAGNGIQFGDNNIYNANLDVIVRCRLDDWTPAAIQTLMSNWRTSGNARSFKFVVTTAGELRLVWSTNGTAESTATSSVALPVGTAPFNVPGGDPVWLRVQLDDAANTIKFFYSLDQVEHRTFGNGNINGSLITWTQLGTTISPGATSLFNPGALTGSIEVGSSNNLADERAVGNFYEASILSGLGGNALISFQLYDKDPLATTFTDSDAHVWSFTGSDVGPLAQLDYIDQTAPLNKDYEYRVTFYAVDLSNFTFAGQKASAAPLNYGITDRCFVQDLDVPENSRHFPVADKWLERTHRQRRTEHWPIGRGAPVFSRAPTQAARFNVTLTVQGEDDIEALMAMVDGGHHMAFLTPKRLWIVDVSGDVELRDHLWDLYHGEEDIEQIVLPLQEVMA